MKTITITFPDEILITKDWHEIQTIKELNESINDLRKRYGDKGLKGTKIEVGE